VSIPDEDASQINTDIVDWILRITSVNHEREQTMTNRLHHKVAIITGAARGIGAETARRFAEEGAHVVLCDVTPEEGEGTASRIRNDGGSAIFLPVDVTDRRSVQDLIDRTVAHFGRLDVLVNNAGVLRDAQLRKMSEDQFDLVINVNLKGVYNCGQAAALQMIEQGNGVILNASSVVGIDGNFGQTNYVATKSAVIGMTKVWARELGPKGIRVNAVAPGFIETDMTAQMPQRIYDSMVEKTPLRRAGSVLDVANAYLWLASDEASFINGVVLRVDGGIVIGT
jgi:3-oxoacyl-[acyl-carrier protein] reductase